MTDTETSGKDGMLAVLRIPSFRWFIAGTTLSNAGMWIQQVTLSWLVYDLTSSGAMLGTLNLVRSIATVGLVPFAGVAIDRFSRRGLLYAASSWLCAISFGFAILLLHNPHLVWSLFVFSFLGGIGQSVTMPLTQTVVFSIVPRNLAPNAVGLVQTSWALMRSVGPALGGFLIVLFGPAGNFFVQAGAYALVALTVFKLSLPYESREGQQEKSKCSIREGWAYLVDHPTTRTFLLMSWINPFFIVPNFIALMPIYAKDVFSGGPDTLGILLSAIGVGGIAGGFVVSSLKRMERRGLLQLGALIFLGLSLILFALSSKLWFAVLLMVLAGFFEIIFLTTNITLLQLSVPDRLRGRVTSIVSLRSGIMPVGAFIAGLGADFVGPRTVSITLGSIVILIAIVIFWAIPTIRGYRLSESLR